VIAPPYFALDCAELVEHFAAAAASCAPLPFYLYEYAQRWCAIPRASAPRSWSLCVPRSQRSHFRAP